MIKYHTNISVGIQILNPDPQHPGKSLDTSAMYCNPSSVDLETGGCRWSPSLALDSEKESDLKKYGGEQSKKSLNANLWPLPVCAHTCAHTHVHTHTTQTTITYKTHTYTQKGEGGGGEEGGRERGRK